MHALVGGSAAAVSLAAVALLAGCSGAASRPAVTVTVTVTAQPSADAGAAAPPASAAAGLTTACQLLSLKEAEAIVGTTLSAGQEGVPDQPSCTYNPDPNGTRTAQVLVTTEDGAKQTYDTDTRLKHTFTDVPGIGDEAHQEELAIYFRKGATWAGISLVYLEDPATVKQALQDAARTVASRLP